jgi:hypothetical protein
MRGDCQRAFARAAALDGIEMRPQSLPWLCQQGHLALPARAATVVAVLDRIYIALGGDLTALAAARLTALTGDFLHEPTGTLVEIDESQHFSSARLATLELYPDDAPLGFNVTRYKELCRQWRAAADNYYRTKLARGFGVGGRQRQRAYYDALRDLATPAMGHPPLVRIDAPLRDGRAAYLAHRERLLGLLTSGSEV